MRLHHSGFIVEDIDTWENKMLFEEKVNDVIDPIQNARLTLYKNFSDSYIELIQPLNEQSFTWNSLQKFGNHFNHFCYTVSNLQEMEKVATENKLIQVLAPVPAVLFNNKKVAFYYSRNKQVVEFLIEE
jgi:methylmalonyl-CoA/ethylmalonyl-CoA epimerase